MFLCRLRDYDDTRQTTTMMFLNAMRGKRYFYLNIILQLSRARARAGTMLTTQYTHTDYARHFAIL